ncbi:MAG: hypothetical protein AAGH64_10730, partial [Planctomycetota bacterium]
PISAAGDMALFAVVRDDASNDLVTGNMVPAAFRLPKVCPIEELYQSGRPIEGLDDIAFVLGSVSLHVYGSGAVRARLDFVNEVRDVALLTLDEDGPAISLGGLYDEYIPFERIEIQINDAGGFLTFDDVGFFSLLAAGPDPDELRFIIDSDGLLIGGERRELSFMDGPSLADDGSVSLWVQVRQQPPGPIQLISVAPNADPVVLAAVRDPIPGTDGLAFGLSRNTFAASEDAVFFFAQVVTSEGEPLPFGRDSGLFLASGMGAVEPIAFLGGTAPGTEGAEFQFIRDITTIGDVVVVNARGDALFEGTLFEGVGDTTPENDVGIWAWDAGVRELRLLIRKGDVIDVSRPGEAPDPRTVTEIRFNPDTGLADNGRIGYTLVFTDGTEAAFTTFVGENAWACTADFDGDGSIGMGDFGVFASAFDSKPGDASYDARADLSGDHDVDLGDFGLFAQRFGRDDCPR